MSIQEHLERDGFARIPGVLTPEEVQRLRRMCRQRLPQEGRYFGYGMVQPNAAVEMEALGWIFHHRGVLGAVRKAIGQEDIIFTGHSDAHLNLLGDWHKDDGGGRYLPEGYFEEDDCRIYKVGLYLQDHKGEGGLYVRRGSHRFPSKEKGEALHCDAQAGDLLIFDVRLTHRGQRPDRFQRLLRAGWNRLPLLRRRDRLFYRLRHAADRLRGRQDRAAIFFTFGVPNHFTRYFARENMRRQVEQTGRSNTELPSSLVGELGAGGVQVPSFE